MAARIVTICALLLSAWPAHAQQSSVDLQFSNGRVSLRAQNAPVRAILAEWGRLGGATIVNGDRVAGAPVTLELTDVPESQALDIVLRTVAGYMLGPRRAGTAGVSAYDRIMILPTSVAPRNPPPPPTPAAARPAFPRPVMPRPQPAYPDDVPDDVAVEDDQTNPLLRPPFSGAVPQPLIRGPVPLGADAQEADEATDEQPAVTGAGSPSNPFGIPAGASARPGVISPMPGQQQPAQQGQPNRVQ